MTFRDPFQPKLMCDSGILCPVPSTQSSSGDDAVSLGGDLEAGFGQSKATVLL